MLKNDQREFLKEMKEEKKKEIVNLLGRGKFKIIIKEEVPRDARVLRGRFVLEIKTTSDVQTKLKARYVLGDYRDR